ncbi:MAG: hypothetical protein AAGD13_18100 [Pseudomonadota bacterium]
MRVRFWLNAFIPRDVASYTRVIPGRGKHSGKSAIPLPLPARLHPGNAIKNRHAGYLSDQRSFDKSATASVRMRSWIEVDLGRSITVTASDHESSGTTEVDLSNGNELGFAIADMSRCSWTTPTRPGGRYRTWPLGVPFQVQYPGGSNSANVLRQRLVGQAGDPLVYAAADIDYEGIVSFVITRRNPLNVMVDFVGKLDRFPAFECYARSGDKTKCLFREPPPAGNTVMSLPGKASRPISGRVQFP